MKQCETEDDKHINRERERESKDIIIQIDNEYERERKKIENKRERDKTIPPSHINEIFRQTRKTRKREKRKDKKREKKNIPPRHIKHSTPSGPLRLRPEEHPVRPPHARGREESQCEGLRIHHRHEGSQRYEFV